MSRRVLVVTTSFPQHDGDPSGHFVRTEVDALARDGAEVVVVAPGARKRSQGNPRVVGIADHGAFGWPGVLTRLRERPDRAPGVLRFVFGARRAVASLGPFDRVIAHWVIPCGWPIATAASAPLEVVTHGSDMRLLERLRLGRPVLAALERRGATLRAVSSELAGRLERLLGRPVPNTAVRPCPIDTSGVPGREAARRQLGVPGDERLAVIVGRLVPGKRVDEAIRLASPRAERLAVIGDGPGRAALEARFPRVQFTGLLPRREALTWIAAADLLVSASRDEGAPTAIREARALGTSVLAVASGDVREWAARDPGIELVD
jgi:teichuronic acid biosynthesis glycosyltransferase TuaC